MAGHFGFELARPPAGIAQRQQGLRRVERALASGKIKSLAAGKMGMSTSEVGDLIAGYAAE